MTADAPKHLSMQDLEAGMDHIRRSPKDQGTLEMIVRRPRKEEREILEEGELHPAEGLVGDNWKARGSSTTPDGSANPNVQVTVMNARVVALLAQNKARWPLAGDQLFVDFDLSEDNLPAGTQLEIGSAIIEVTPPPHTGCKKFTARYGLDAVNFVNSPIGKQLHLRGVNAKIVRAGGVRVGDSVRKISRQ
jgi:MOSC domain-containing protein YiiM